MKILAVSGSPRKTEGSTERVLKPFLDGARAAGAEVDLIYLQGKKIKPCLGCYHCWWKTPGVCAQKDEMAEILPRLKKADVVVYATPLYVFGMSGQMKVFMDRFIPNLEPWIEVRDGHCGHPKREGNRYAGLVLISGCGFHELDNFDALVNHFQTVARLGHVNFLGALLRPHAETLAIMEKFAPDKVKPIFAAAFEAGRQIASGQPISDQTAKQVAQELIPLADFVKAANAYFKHQMEEHGLAVEKQ